MKKRNKKRSKTNLIGETEVFVHEMNYEKLAESIVYSSEKLELKKNKINEEQRKVQQAEWDKILKQQVYAENEKWLHRKWHKFRNEWMAYKELMLFKEKNVKDAIATFALIKLATEMMFSCIKWCLYIFTIMFIYNFIVNPKDNGILMAFAFIAWTIARLIRIAVFEIKKMEDTNLILAIFSGSISFVALIVAIVAMVVS